MLVRVYWIYTQEPSRGISPPSRALPSPGLADNSILPVESDANTDSRRRKEYRPFLNQGLREAGYTVDLARREVTQTGASVHRSVREFALLEYLTRYPDQVLTRAQIAERIWKSDDYGVSNVVDVYIGYLRRKISSEARDNLIRTVRGLGYSLNTPESTSRSAT